MYKSLSGTSKLSFEGYTSRGADAVIIPRTGGAKGFRTPQ